jgi:hypothetical protein
LGPGNSGPAEQYFQEGRTFARRKEKIKKKKKKLRGGQKNLLFLFRQIYKKRLKYRQIWHPNFYYKLATLLLKVPGLYKTPKKLKMPSPERNPGL